MTHKLVHRKLDRILAILKSKPERDLDNAGLKIHCRDHLDYDPAEQEPHADCSTCADLQDLYLFSFEPDGHDVHINPEEIVIC